MEVVTVDANGRILVPAAVRRSLGLAPGSQLLLSVTDGRLLLEKREDAWRRAQGLFDGNRPSGSVVEELLAERRADGRLETS